MENQKRSKFPSIKDLKEKDEKEILAKILKYYLINEDLDLSIKDIIKKYSNELKLFCKIDNDTKDTFGFVNTWWVFGEVTKEDDYSIFMSEVENVGYKRTKRGENKKPNDLFRTNSSGEVIVDDGVKKTVLDHLREIEWD